MQDLILDDGLVQNEVKLVKASNGIRFVNFLLDYIFVIILMIGVFVFFDVFGIMDIDDEESLLDDLLGIVVYILYYTLTEGGLKGKSLAKYLTGTRVVNLDGTLPDFNTAVKRSLSRIVPFEAFSFLFADTGWHDDWTDTRVIVEKESVLPAEF